MFSFILCLFNFIILASEAKRKKKEKVEYILYRTGKNILSFC